jgi:GH24 family phage-related lysozyme (muramidase)
MMATGRVTATALNVRTSPQTGQVVGVLRQGCIVDIQSQSAGWANITATQDGQNLIGWASASFIASDLPTAPPAISEKAIQMIVGFEVTSEAYYTKEYTHPTWPQGQSGVTIGIGYDVGYVAEQDLRSDWAGLLDDATLTALVPACGVKGTGAKPVCASLQTTVTVPWTAANTVFRARSIPAYTVSTIHALPRAAQLSPDCLGALVSLVYNRGPSFNADGDRYAEMRAIRDDIASGALTDIPTQLRSMKRLWQGDPAAAGLVARRETEAQLFEAGLSQIQAGA